MPPLLPRGVSMSEVPYHNLGSAGTLTFGHLAQDNRSGKISPAPSALRCEQRVAFVAPSFRMASSESSRYPLKVHAAAPKLSSHTDSLAPEEILLFLSIPFMRQVRLGHHKSAMWCIFARKLRGSDERCV